MLVTCTSAKGGVGKTTSAMHIAAYLAADDSTLLIDGDPNRSSQRWSQRGAGLPFKVVTLPESPRHTKNHEHIVFDTPARPSEEDLKALADGCDLLVIPTSPDILSIDASLETVDLLESFGCDRYKLLLTIVPPAPRKTGEKAREALAEFPMFKQWIRRFAAYETASLQGCLVQEVKGDRNARIAWSDYQRVGKELMDNG